MALLIFLVGKICFQLLFKYWISLLFRAFTMLGLLSLSLMEGKIEVYTFQFISEMLFLNFDGFIKKMHLAGMVYFYFIFLIIASSSMFVFLLLYGEGQNISSTTANPRYYRHIFASSIQDTIIVLEIISACMQILIISGRLAENYFLSNLLVLMTFFRIFFMLLWQFRSSIKILCPIL